MSVKKVSLEAWLRDSFPEGVKERLRLLLPVEIRDGCVLQECDFWT